MPLPLDDEAMRSADRGQPGGFLIGERAGEWEPGGPASDHDNVRAVREWSVPAATVRKPSPSAAGGWDA